MASFPLRMATARRRLKLQAAIFWTWSLLHTVVSLQGNRAIADSPQTLVQIDEAWPSPSSDDESVKDESLSMDASLPAREAGLVRRRLM